MTTASAPASSANLGPGYDVLALALDLRCRVTVAPADEWAVLSGGAPAEPGGVELVRRSASAASPESGPFRVEIQSEIPLARGLGSSAALIAATVAAVAGLSGTAPDRDRVFEAAAAVEGHPDNVAAAVHGGLVAVGADGRVRQLPVDPSLQVLVAVPDTTLSTPEARRATADPVSTGVASRTAARLAFLVAGLRTADPDALAAAAGDELHESRRAHLSPVTGRLIDAAREAGALHACWSGAGPSALALVTGEAAPAVRQALEVTLEGGYVLSPDVDRTGLLIG